MTTELQAKQAYEVEERIKNTLQEMKRAWVYLAEDLYHFQKNAWWHDLGYASFDEWLAGPDIDLKRRQAYYLIATYKELVVEQGATPAMLEGVGISKAKVITTAVRRKEVPLVEALADAEALAHRDLVERYAKLEKGDPAEKGTGYSSVAEPARAQCPSCGSWYTVAGA